MKAVPVSHRVNAERIVVLGWPRAILLQLAHPLVAAGIDDHSTFRGGGLTAARRLHHTIRAMLALTFGSEQKRADALNGIRAIHRRVHGTLRSPAGMFPAGTKYSAEDADLVLWVHATLLDSIPLAYVHFVGPLTEAELDAYCAEAATVAIELGARHDDVPRTWAATQRYLTAMYESGAIVVTDTACELAAQVLSPAFAPFVAPVAAATRLMTFDMLPPAIREQYGFVCSTRDARWAKLIYSVAKRVRRVLPRSVALWPEALIRFP